MTPKEEERCPSDYEVEIVSPLLTNNVQVVKAAVLLLLNIELEDLHAQNLLPRGGDLPAAVHIGRVLVWEVGRAELVVGVNGDRLAALQLTTTTTTTAVAIGIVPLIGARKIEARDASAAALRRI